MRTLLTALAMTLSKVHAKIQEEKNKLNRVDARRFNSRSREKMEREIRVIQKSAKKLERKSTAKKHLHKGIFSAEEVAFAKVEDQKFRDKCMTKRSRRDKSGLPLSSSLVCA